MAGLKRIFIPDIEAELSSRVVDFPEFKYDTPSFDYKDISFNKTKYCFNNNSLTKKELHSYFERIKKVCSIPINSIEGDGQADINYHIVDDPNTLLIEKTKALLKLPKDTSKGMLPQLGQFGLYTDNQLSTHKVSINKLGVVVKGAKQTEKYSPRIFFAIGRKGIFRLLFFDLKHELGNRPK